MLKPVKPKETPGMYIKRDQLKRRPENKIAENAKKAKSPVFKAAPKTKTPSYTSKEVRKMQVQPTYKDPKSGKTKHFEKQRRT